MVIEAAVRDLVGIVERLEQRLEALEKVVKDMPLPGDELDPTFAPRRRGRPRKPPQPPAVGQSDDQDDDVGGYTPGHLPTKDD